MILNAIFIADTLSATIGQFMAVGSSICGIKYLGLSWAICIKALHQARCRSREFALMRRPCITVRVLYLFSIFIIFSCT